MLIKVDFLQTFAKTKEKSHVNMRRRFVLPFYFGKSRLTCEWNAIFRSVLYVAISNKYLKTLVSADYFIWTRLPVVLPFTYCVSLFLAHLCCKGYYAGILLSLRRVRASTPAWIRNIGADLASTSAWTSPRIYVSMNDFGYIQAMYYTLYIH